MLCRPPYNKSKVWIIIATIVIFAVCCRSEVTQAPCKDCEPQHRDRVSHVAAIYLQATTDASIKWDNGKGWSVDEVPAWVRLRIFFISESDISGYYVAFTNNPLSCVNITSVAHHLVKRMDSMHVPGDAMYYVEGDFTGDGNMYICISSFEDDWTHQGQGAAVRFSVHLQKGGLRLPLGASIALVIACLLMSGLFSGLNLGLMSLDIADLNILREAGSTKERYYAGVIYPLRKRGNFLLCSILLSNTLVNCTQTIIIDGIVHGIYATIAATLLIVIFGEIIPQAICSRYGLMIGARTSMFTMLMMLLTSPLSWPFSKILDYTLGKQPPSAFSREKIRVLIKEQSSDVDKQEKDIISGVLTLRDKTAEEHMRSLNDVYMISAEAPFSEDLFTSICTVGYSRIPVYEKCRSNVVGVLHIKDLALLGTSHRRNVSSIIEGFNLPFGVCEPLDRLDTLLSYILRNHFHMLLVQRNVDGKRETIGTITLEDIMEEMLDLEIYDEFDDNFNVKAKRHWKNTAYLSSRSQGALTPQMRLGAIQFLSTLDPFKESVVDREVLGRLIDQSYIEEKSSQRILYEIGKPTDHFILIVSGKVVLCTGAEKLRFELGPFGYLGLPALTLPTKDERSTPFLPDYSVSVDGDLGYLKITRAKWIAAARVSAFERSKPTFLVGGGGGGVGGGGSHAAQIASTDHSSAYHVVQTEDSPATDMHSDTVEPITPDSSTTSVVVEQPDADAVLETRHGGDDPEQDRPRYH